MSSEIFSTVRIQPVRRVDITKRTRAQIASAKNALRQMSRTMSETARIMQTQGRAMSDILRAQGETDTTTVSQATAGGGGAVDVSGFDRSSIDAMVAALRQTQQLLSIKGEDSDELSDEKLEGVTVTASQAVTAGALDESGYVREDIFELPEGEVMSSDERKILEYSDLLKLTKSKKDVVYTELLIAMFAMFEAPVWSDGDIDLKERTRRRVERLDSDKTFTIDEKIEKLRQIIAEYSNSLSSVPEEFNSEELIAEYKYLRRRLGRLEEEISISRMAAEVEAMTQEIIKAEEEAYIRKCMIEAFEREGILLDEYVCAKGRDVFYLEDEENCEVILEDIEGGFLLESVGLSENGKKASKEEKDEMVTSAKKVCDKYKRVIKHLEEMGIDVNIDAEDEPDARYIKVAHSDSETQDRRHKKKTTRRRFDEKKNKRTFD